ncbi:hypothetical protein EIP91_001877 [Steccherinum ochraceum]|uniref:Uncharacterized protein n=1 Tax=Steccherinum ochraceum TaxID=92696 RepID=A0A4R0RQH8_9APHY|nr:hypothetical protein EIP91_001877 [Steccherinum ochraceum]
MLSHNTEPLASSRFALSFTKSLCIPHRPHAEGEWVTVTELPIEPTKVLNDDAITIPNDDHMVPLLHIWTVCNNTRQAQKTIKATSRSRYAPLHQSRSPFGSPGALTGGLICSGWDDRYVYGAVYVETYFHLYVSRWADDSIEVSPVRGHVWDFATGRGLVKCLYYPSASKKDCTLKLPLTSASLAKLIACAQTKD